MSGNAAEDATKSPGMRALEKAAEEVVMHDSLEGVKAIKEAADIMAASGEVPLSSLNDSGIMTSSTTIANALSSSADMGGKAVNISLPTQTPMKSPGMSPAGTGHGLAQTTPLTEGKLLDQRREDMLGQANAAIDAALAKSVTINEKENTAQSPSSSAFVGNKAAMPTLKDAGASAQKLDSQAKRSPAKRAVSPPKRKDPEASNGRSSEVTDQEKAKAKYLLARAYNRKSNDSPDKDRRLQGDRYSSYSGSSGGSRGSQRSVRTTESDIARKLRASQQRLRDSQDRGRREDVRTSKERAMDAVFSSLSEQQQALFLSMKSTSQPKGPSRGTARNSSPDSKSVASSYDDNSSVRSSRSGTSSRSSSKGSKKGRPASASALRLSTSDLQKISDRLTQPVFVEPSAEEKARDPTLKYLLIDEAKNCRSKPFKAKRWAGSNRADDDEAKSNFIERMESQEYHRREDMAHRRAAADYNALLTRKECPNCGLKQKYDEVKDKKTKCPNCDIEYRPKLTWGQVGRSFMTRTSKHSAESQAKKEELVKELEEMEEPKLQRFDPKLGKVVTVAAPKNKKRWTESTKAEFFERMDEHSEKAKKNLQKIEDESFGVQCTFMPKTGAKRDEEDEEDTGVHAFLRRLDEEWEDKKAKSPHLFTEKFSPDPLLEGKPSWKPT